MMLKKGFHIGTLVVFLICFLEVFSHNVQNLDQSKLGDYQVQTISSPEDKETNIHVIYSSDYGPQDGSDYSVDDSASLDTWSIVWYIASFGGLILFFLIVSCSEWCCRRNARRGCQRTNGIQSAVPIVLDTPPPSYDQFAPPSYEELWVGSSRRVKSEKGEYDVYVVPVHALGPIMENARTEDSPPSYQASAGLANTSQLPRIHSLNASTSVT